MSLRLNEVVAPPIPASGKMTLFADIADEKIKVIDDLGFKSILTPDGWRDRNIILNGDFQFFQRGTHVATLNTNRTYGADMWGMSIQASSNTFTQVDTSGAPETGYEPQYYGKFTQTTAASKLVLSQVISHESMAHLRNDPVRFQFEARQSAGTNIVLRFGIMQLTAAGTINTVTDSGFISAYGANAVDPTFPANHTLIAPRLVDVSSGAIAGNAITTNSLTSTWTQYSGVFDIPSNSKNLVFLVWTHNQMAINDALCIGEVSAYLGEEIRVWTPRSEQMESRELEHYYNKSFPATVTPAASVAVATGGNGICGIIGKAAATALAVHIPIQFPVRMHNNTPTITLYTPVTTGAVPYRHNGTTPAAQTSVAQLGVTDRGLIVTATGDLNGAVGDLVGVHYTAECKL